jgi:hypothetical protein
MIIFAVDPGKMTGFARWDNGHFSSSMLEHMPFLESMWLVLLMPQNRPDLVVCESFIITAQTLKKSRGENWSLEQIGAIRWMCHTHGVPFKLQTPADAKSFVKNERLKELGWYKPGAGHDNDAARHLLLALARNDPPAFTALMRNPN